MMKRKSGNYGKIEAGTWLTTYADLMNNLLVLFIMLYMMSVIDLQKFKDLSSNLSEAFGGKSTDTSAAATSDDTNFNSYVPYTTESETTADIAAGQPQDEIRETLNPDETAEMSDGSGIMDDLDEFVNRIRGIIKDKGYEDQTIVERIDNYVYLRFREGVLFYPNLASLKPDSYDILRLVSEIISEAYDEIYRIDICGHTAWVPIDNLDTNFNSWELSSERSLTVLKFFVSDCKIPKDKLTMSAYSSTEPYTNGITEEEKAMNRRVEIRLSRIIDVTEE